MQGRMLLAAYALIVTACAAPGPSRAPAGAPEYQSMMKAMQDAEAGASRPGDARLSCKQLLDELGAITSDSKLHGVIQDAGKQAQQDVAAAQQAQAQMGAQTALAAGSTLPGGNAAALAAAIGSAEAAKARGAARMPAMREQAQQMTALMPQMMRGQRINQLATAKKCDWAASPAQ